MKTAPEFQVVTKDNNGREVDVSTKFSLDASQFLPFELPTDNFIYTLGTPYVQQLGTYRVNFDLEVPMESTGCYIKFTFPNELKVTS